MPEFPTARYDDTELIFITNAQWFREKTGVAIDDVSRTWSTANQSIATPIYIPRKMTVKKLYAYNGAAVSGNCCIALYDFDKTTGQTHGARDAFNPYLGPRLTWNGGWSLQAGVSQWQIFDVSDYTIYSPGIYLLAYQLDNTTGQNVMLANVPIRAVWKSAGIQSGADFPLPANWSGVDYGPYKIPQLALGGIA